MHLGLIGGIGPAATDYYYRRLIASAARDAVDLDLTIAHADAPALLARLERGDAAGQVAVYRRLAERLRAAGADTLAVTSIAGHFCIDEFKASAPLPVIDLIECVDDAIRREGHRRVGALGALGVMTSGLFGKIRAAEVVAPRALDAAHEAYVALALSGRSSAASRAVFVDAGRSLIAEQGCDAVLLAGADLVLAFDGADEPGFPAIDCAGLHVEALARAAAR